MKISKIEVKNFRSLNNISCDVDDISLFIGRNSAGKSNILKAIFFSLVKNSLFDKSKVLNNFSCQNVGPAAKISIKLTFENPNAELISSLPEYISSGMNFTYNFKASRKSLVTREINGKKLTETESEIFLNNFELIHIPPIRDLNSGGLEPFLKTFSKHIWEKGYTSGRILRKEGEIKSLIESLGNEVLQPFEELAKKTLSVEELKANVNDVSIDKEKLITAIDYKIGNQRQGIDKLGTGHQSSVILGLYRSLGLSSEKFVLYLFEEPDNHLHPTLIWSIADDIKKCSSDSSQLFITTHSATLINNFDSKCWIPVDLDSGRRTNIRPFVKSISKRELLIGLSKYGMRPAEALLSKKVVVVEGPTDVTLIRVLYEKIIGDYPEKYDILIVPAGGKDGVADLTNLLFSMGVKYTAVYDWDSTFDTSRPMFVSSLSAADKAVLSTSLTTISSKLASAAGKKSRTSKIIDALQVELTSTSTPNDFKKSIIYKSIKHTFNATLQASAATKVAVKKDFRNLMYLNNIWIWSDDQESFLTNKKGSCAEIESVLSGKTHLPKPIILPSSQIILKHYLHELAHEPILLSEICESLYDKKLINLTECRKLVDLINN